MDRDEPRDPLELRWHGRAVVLVTALTSLLVLVASASGGGPSVLPGIALGSPALLHLERALVVGALVAGACIFTIRGWVGYFPSKLSTTGAEYATRPSIERAATNYDEAIDALAEIGAEHIAMAESMGEDVRAVELEVEALARGLREVRATIDIDDML